MVRPLYLMVAFTVMAGMAAADSLRIGDVWYRDVYIRVSQDYYYVHHPDTGVLEKVSRRRRNVSDLVISPNATRREAILERYRAARDAAQAAEQETRSTTPRVDGDLLKKQRRLESLALFESQLAHWQGLSPERQQWIEQGLGETLEQRTEQRVADHTQAVDQIEILDSDKMAVEERVVSAAYARETAVEQAQADDASNFYLDAYENSKGYVGPVYHYYYDEHDRLRAVPTWWYTEDPSLYDAALAERHRTERRIGEAEEDYRARMTRYENELESVEKAISQRERDARAALSKAHDETLRYSAWQARVAALKEADETGYRPQMIPTPIAEWSGSGERRSPEFTVGRGLWRLECKGAGLRTPNGFSVTVYDATTDTPFTRISNGDFLGMRARIFDRPGTYYVVIDQGIDTVNWEVSVTTLDL